MFRKSKTSGSGTEMKVLETVDLRPGLADELAQGAQVEIDAGLFEEPRLAYDLKKGDEVILIFHEREDSKGDDGDDQPPIVDTKAVARLVKVSQDIYDDDGYAEVCTRFVFEKTGVPIERSVRQPFHCPECWRWVDPPRHEDETPSCYGCGWGRKSD